MNYMWTTFLQHTLNHMSQNVINSIIVIFISGIFAYWKMFLICIALSSSLLFNMSTQLCSEKQRNRVSVSSKAVVYYIRDIYAYDLESPLSLITRICHLLTKYFYFNKF